MASVDQTIDSALRMNGLIAPGQTWALGASSSLRIAAIEILNSMLQSWGVEGINIPCEVSTTPLQATVGQRDYTVGPTGDIAITPRPNDLSTVIWRIPATAGGGPTDYILAQLSDPEWEEWRLKETTGFPIGYNYTNKQPNGVLSIIYVPNTAYQIVLYVPQLFTTYTLGTNPVNLSDGYDEAIRLNLALRYRTEFSSLGARMDPETLMLVQQGARDSKLAVQRLNFRIPTVRSDFPSGVPALNYDEFQSGLWLRW